MVAMRHVPPLWQGESRKVRHFGAKAGLNTGMVIALRSTSH